MCVTMVNLVSGKLEIEKIPTVASVDKTSATNMVLNKMSPQVSRQVYNIWLRYYSYPSMLFMMMVASSSYNFLCYMIDLMLNVSQS